MWWCVDTSQGGGVMFQRLTLWGIPNFSCVRVFGLLGMIEKKRRKKTWCLLQSRYIDFIVNKYIDYNIMSVCEKQRTKMIHRLGYALVFLFPIFYLICFVFSNASSGVQWVFQKNFGKHSHLNADCGELERRISEFDVASETPFNSIKLCKLRIIIDKQMWTVCCIE